MPDVVRPSSLGRLIDCGHAAVVLADASEVQTILIRNGKLFHYLNLPKCDL